MKKGKSKPVKVTYTSEYQAEVGGKKITLYGFNVEFEDGTKGLYNSINKDKPKFVVGEEAEYTADEREKNGKKYTIIKHVSPNAYGSKWQPKPDNVVALEWARRMYNSSHNTGHGWQFEQLLQMAGYLHGLLKGGTDKDAIECAVTIQCANAMGDRPIDTKELSSHIKQTKEWLKENS